MNGFGRSRGNVSLWTGGGVVTGNVSRRLFFGNLVSGDGVEVMLGLGRRK